MGDDGDKGPLYSNPCVATWEQTSLGFCVHVVDAKTTIHVPDRKSI